MGAVRSPLALLQFNCRPTSLCAATGRLNGAGLPAGRSLAAPFVRPANSLNQAQIEHLNWNEWPPGCVRLVFLLISLHFNGATRVYLRCR
jgi:hypothetical protein